MRNSVRRKLIRSALSAKLGAGYNSLRFIMATLERDENVMIDGETGEPIENKIVNGERSMVNGQSNGAERGIVIACVVIMAVHVLPQLFGFESLLKAIFQ